MPLPDLDEIKAKVDAHWEYVKGVLQARSISDDILKEIEYHYLTAGIHFYGHGWEDCEKGNWIINP